MSAKSQRLGRIEGEMQRVLSTLVSREVRDPRVGNVTVTHGERRAGHVARRASSSCRSASKHTPEEVTRRPESRRRVSCAASSDARCQLRHAPKLEFVYDQQIENADKLTRLIDGAVKSDQHEPDPDRNLGAMPTGILLLDKPQGLTSNGALQRVRTRLRRRRAPGTSARSIRWPPACCRCASTKPPR